MAEKKNNRYGVWFIVILILVGLAGFGADGLTGNVRNIGKVGEKDVSLSSYQNALNNQLRALSAQFGSPISFQQASAFGIDRLALGQLILTRSLDNEASQLGLSAGDENVLERLRAIPQFQGAGGTFNRESYRFSLQNSGQSETEFETGLREEIARTLLQAAVVGGVPTVDAYADTIVQYAGERRSITWASIGSDALTSPVPGATEADQQAYYDANPAEFTLPEARKITYAWLTPTMIQDEVTVSEADVEALYQDRIDQFVLPERRLVERLVYLDAALADEAAARIADGASTFEDLVAERGLTLSDVDLGDQGQAQLGAAGEAVFAANPGDVVGPFNSSVGPALFRMNAILVAQETPLEEAAPALRDELAAIAAADIINDSADQIIDLLAGGATMADLADRTQMELGTIDWTPDMTEGIAAYDAFRSAAASAEEGQFAELINLSDGGVFALQLDEIIPPALQPIDEVREAVATAWQAEARQQAIIAKAEEIAADIQPLTEFETLDLTASVDEDLTRRSFLEGTPPNFNEAMFEMTLGEVRVIGADNSALIVRLDAITPPDPTSETVIAQREQLANEAASGIAQDLFDAYATRLQEETDVSIDQRTVDAVNAQFQ